jgi:hypothetical protein
MRPRFGDTWLEDLRRRRHAAGAGDMYRRKLNLYDPSFAVNEPLHNSDSPLRECLPSGRKFYDLLEQTNQIRNREQHFDRIPSLAGLVSTVEVVGRLAREAELPMAGDCVRVTGRIKELSSGDSEIVDETVRYKELLADREADKERTRQLAGEVAELRAHLRDKDQLAALGDVESEQLRVELQEAELTRAAAEDELLAAQIALEEQLAVMRSEHLSADLSDLEPGDPGRVHRRHVH